MTSPRWAGGRAHPIASRMPPADYRVAHRDTGCVPFIERVASREIYRNRGWCSEKTTFADRTAARHLRRGGQADIRTGDAYDGRRFRLVEQFRYPLGARRWEFPQGSAPGLAELEPTELAARELREETGLRASSFEALGLLDVAAGMTSQRGWVFLATGISEGGVGSRTRGAGHAQRMVRSRRRGADDPLGSARPTRSRSPPTACSC